MWGAIWQLLDQLAAITIHFAASLELQSEKPLMPTKECIVSLLSNTQLSRGVGNSVEFKRKRRKLSYAQQHKNEVLRLCCSRQPCEDGKIPSVAAVIREYESQNPGVSIPETTIRGLLNQGYDGDANPAPLPGGKSKIPYADEREMAWQVQLQPYTRFSDVVLCCNRQLLC